jgi:hypothetical protein
MSGWETRQSADPDDWFAESMAARRTAEPDDWLDDRPSRRQLPRDLYGYDLRLWLAGAGLLVVLVIAGLAIGGVFSSGKKHAATPPVHTPTTTPNTTPSKPVVKAPPAPTTTLKPGDTGVEVKRLQRALKFLGYPSGKVDGDYGAATKAALVKFQKAKKLDGDGVLGPKTLAALKTALTA